MRSLATSEVINRMVHEPRWALSKVREPQVVERGDWMDTPVGRGKVTMKRRYRTDVSPDGSTYKFQDVVEVQVPDQGYITLPVRVLQSRRTLIEGSRLSGFDYFSDFLQDDDYARIHAYVGKYWNNSSGANFIDFLGYIKRTRFSIEQLWTDEKGDPGDPSNSTTPANAVDNYTQIEPMSAGASKVWNAVGFNFSDPKDPGYAGYQYPTAHVALSYDVVDHPNIDQLGVMSLFYYLAPIHLVLQRYVGTVFSTELLKAGLAPQVSTIEEAADSWDTTSLSEIKVGATTQVSTVIQRSVGITWPLP